MAAGNKWQFWIDRGGTFTDVVTRRPDGTLSSDKFLSENPEHYEDAAVYAMRQIMQVPSNAPFPRDQVSAIKMGTTVATNALLERQGEPTLLLVTRGFRDALLIGQQHRNDLFALKPTRPKPIYDDVIEIEERIGADGTVVLKLDLTSATKAMQAAFAKGLRSCAICLVHGYRYPAHEEALATAAEAVGFDQISVSHQVSPLMKFISRGDTTVADAYLSPILRQYVDQVRGAVGDTPLYFMQSNGGLAEASAFAGKDAVLSGPAGGIVGAAHTSKRAGAMHIVGFDMGGTSTDVSHYSGDYERVTDSVVAGVRMTVPMMDIHTVAAGGGSICTFSQGRFLVGPESAGANPGPASYGRGGPLTVTDCNVLLGKLQPDLFPAIFGQDGNQALNSGVVKIAFQNLAVEIEDQTGNCLSSEEIAEGFIAVAVEHMARAIKRVSVERGHDIQNHALLSFGGAGGQHACLVAEALGITRVIVPPFSGVLSALGIGLANISTVTNKATESDILDVGTLTETVTELCELAAQRLAKQGLARSNQNHRVTGLAKYRGSDTTLPVPFGTAGEMRQAFEQAHKVQFGFTDKDAAVILQSLQVEASGKTENDPLGIVANGTSSEPLSYMHMQYASRQMKAAVYDKAVLVPDHKVIGPAIIIENGGTTIVEPGWTAHLTATDTLEINRTEHSGRNHVLTEKPDPILLEIFNNLFMSVAEEMGGVLARTARSVNIKERLDFSCAVFDRTGNLIANAPHMPVHLGSMGESVKAILEARGSSVKDGDVFMVNDPYAGGTHLPDITVITPLFLGDETSAAFFVASRGHHSDIGGISPGSMPPHSCSIEEEGIRFTNFHLVQDGIFNEKAVRIALASGPYPARSPDQNIADLKAQVAANKRGCLQVIKLTEHYGAHLVHGYMDHVQDNAEEAVKQLIGRLHDGSYSYAMDCGGTVEVAIKLNKKARTAVIDFTGTSGQLINNFNAPLAVTKAAVLYVFRTLTGCDIPLNAGCMKPLELIVPKGSMLNPTAPAAVVAGNVETSQAVTNALFLAVGALAAAQGTMNNFTFGNDQYQYYETIAGGTGAGPNFDGTDVIQSHMTNSRLTDPEVLEWRYPVRLREFSIRPDTGGPGHHTGGNGATRVFEFLDPMEAAILSSHRTDGPPGIEGGSNGTVGRTFITRVSGAVEKLEASGRADIQAGDTVTILTPGGGGYGKPSS
ncbi:MAG: 5-oxoprolinase [Kordiimonadales bacterium]|nr:MAG: 5-oxoprolinase [Kordiimonadales bacterium]